MDSSEGFSLGWDTRALYEQPPADLLEAEAFFSAFAKFHDIDGNNIECIYTKAKRQPITITSGTERGDLDGISAVKSVLIVRDDEDLAGVEQGGSLRIDGTHCRIMSVSRPVMGLIRMELEGYSG